MPSAPRVSAMPITIWFSPSRTQKSAISIAITRPAAAPARKPSQSEFVPKAVAKPA